MTLLQKFRSKYLDIRWNIGFFPFTEHAIIGDTPWTIRWLRHNYRDRWFADPFLLKTTESTIDVLVEEFPLATRKGILSRLTIDARTYELLKRVPVLELPTHLSFPAIFRQDKEIYVYPENSAAGHLVYYRYDPGTNRCTPCGPLSDKPLTDGIIEPLNGKYYLFSTRLPDPNGNRMDIYSSENAFSPYHRCVQEVLFTDQTARNAGGMFRLNGSLFRPAQDCNGSYGKGLVFQQVINDNDTFSFREFRRIYPATRKYSLGMHTFNTNGRLCVIDARGYRYPFVGHCVDRLRKIRNFFR